MARANSNKRDVSGWLIVDKPVGMTSSAIVNKVKWAFDAKKAGHTGTLDPMATGVLAIALGEATKTIPCIADVSKAYSFTVKFGTATNTDDAQGTPTTTSNMRPSDSDIEAALPAFTGEIHQVPPQFSAVKVDGERAYKRARIGVISELASRPLHVQSLTLSIRNDPDHATFHMVCGKGGYVRSIARDLGLELGCFGHVTALRRLWTGPFDLDTSTVLDDVEKLAKTADIDALLLPLETALRALPELPCTPQAAATLRNGNPAPVLSSEANYGDQAWAALDGRAVAIGTYMSGALHPSRVFVWPTT